MATTLLLALAAGCSGASDEGVDATQDHLREDTTRAPHVVRVPIRFTRNDVSDVGYGFSSSWVPFTGVSRDKMDGYKWGLSSADTATKLEDWFKPDHPGAGYATAYFRVEIPYDTTGQLAYGLARVKLESEFLQTTMATMLTRKYSALRIRSGSDQPCLSITMQGALEGKLKPVELPFTDQGFTERDWNVGDTDETGVPIKRVILGTFQFSPYCWPENVEGTTQASMGVGIPPGGFAMVDKSSGQGGGEGASVFVNLVENQKGEVTVGDVFSTSGGILGERDRKAFDAAVTAFAPQFAADVGKGISAAAAATAAAGTGL